ncbi:MAG: NADH-quinone oxidoreductase subunit NuoG [Ardenticatenaceae bacterium]|nr:NADH-quinone oxidoreductase subunit NuoG [Ardenticatenaceae bacterium]MCB9445335.1 NADH-quinone oxidoreductase subunit NuoG [Ardenticatenaceae bacterium]
MATITIDGKTYEVKDGQNLLQAALSQGVNLPYFCWHPALGSVGACRQCAVKQYRDENDENGRLVMACMTPANDGSHFAIEEPDAQEFRSAVTEWLMVNHPHDCPVCDEGGECHLQDMVVMTGHNYREFRFNKRTHRNQDLGPFINHEMNRCISCYRCVRYYRDYAGGRDFNVFGAHDHVYFGRYEDGPLESEFSGNLIEICPTGVFTDKTEKQHYTRKWDLQTAPSICHGCSLGCNIIPGERYGTLRRIRNRYNYDVNGYFLCDRGRFGYEYVNSERRIQQARVNGEVVEPEVAINHITTLLQNGTTIGIGSPRASLESNFALRRLVGQENFYMGISKHEAELMNTAVSLLQHIPTPSLREIGEADAVLILGEDVTNTAPLMALALRQSVRQQAMDQITPLSIPQWQDMAVREALQNEPNGPLFIGSMHHTRLDDIATHTYHAAPEDLARLGFAIAHALDESAPTVPDLDPELAGLVDEIGQALRDAKRPLIISGVSSGSEAVMQAAANAAFALNGNGRLSLIFPAANSLGAALLGGKSTEDAPKANTVIVLENDVRRWAAETAVSTGSATRTLDSAEQVIVLDYMENDTTKQADIVLPAAAFAEADGTLVNNEGRAQRFYQVYIPESDAQAGWRWLEAIRAAQTEVAPFDWDGLVMDIAASGPIFANLSQDAPLATFRINGQKIARQPMRYSGHTSIHADRSVSEPPPVADPDSPLAFSMEGSESQPPAALVNRYWAPGWNSVQSLNHFQEEIGGPLRGGSKGVRIFTTVADDHTYFETIPAAFTAADDVWRVLPIYHIFGSEELSAQSPAIAARAPRPYLALNPDDAAKLELAEGETAALGQDLSLPVKLLHSLPKGTIGLPIGLSGHEELVSKNVQILPSKTRMQLNAD